MARGNIVMIFADGGWKYLGTDLWADDADESHATTTAKTPWTTSSGGE